MWKKVFLLAAGMLAVVLLITGVMTAVNADSANNSATTPSGVRAGPPPGPHPGRGFCPPMGGAMLDKVAARLNIDKATLQDAFKQVMMEEQQARQVDMFAKLVSDGKLTQVQADAYKAWLDTKPADLPGFPFFEAAKSTVMLDRLLANGKISQVQYDAYKAWIAQKPAVELPKPGRPAGGPPCLQEGTSK